MEAVASVLESYKTKQVILVIGFDPTIFGYMILQLWNGISCLLIFFVKVLYSWL